MSRRRVLTLTLGPLAIVGFLYWTTMPPAAEALTTQTDAARPARPVHADEPAQAPALQGQSLVAACRDAAKQLAAQLGGPCRILTRPPYVLAGDISEAQLDRQYRETILPTARALETMYFDRPANRPITLVLLSGEQSYQQAAERLDGLRRTRYAGYYQRSKRRIVLNLETGSGTLAHELTHALAHFDFPAMPEWFDEGFASLNEQCEFSEDGLLLQGQSNWRLHYLVPAIRNGTLRPLSELVGSAQVRSSHEAIDYAQSRFFCLYLQERQLLGPFYRKFRNQADRDPTGLQTLCSILQTDALTDTDRAFREWVMGLPRVRK